MNELALFAGTGGGILGGRLLGWRTICAVEINPYRARRLMQRQNEGHLAPFPVWDDVCTFNGHPWRGIVDVISGGFPCTDISRAGKRAGIDGSHSGLWVEMARIIREVRPGFVLVENSPELIVRGLGRVLGDLASIGYDAKWGMFRASDEGAPIERERIFIAGTHESHGKKKVGDWEKEKIFRASGEKCPAFWKAPPDRFIGVGNGLANYVESVESIGDGQVPAVVRTAWRVLTQ